MAENGVTTTFFGNSADAEAAIARLEKKYDDLENRIKQVSRSSRSGSGEMLGNLKEISTVAASLAIGFTSVVPAIEQMISSTITWHKELARTTMEMDKIRLSVQAQGAGFGAQSKENVDKLLNAGAEGGLSASQSQSLFGQLVARGADGDKLIEKFADISAAYKTANDAKGGTLGTSDFAESISKLMGRDGEMTADSIIKSGREFYGMAAGTELGSGDINAAFAALSEMTSQRGLERRVNALADIGLNLEEVDLTGEDMQTALGKIQKGLDKFIPKNEQAGWWKSLGVSSDTADHLLAGLDKRGANDANYDAAMRASTSDWTTRVNRTDTAKLIDDATKGQQAAEFEQRQRLANQMDMKSSSFPALQHFANIVGNQIAGFNFSILQQSPNKAMGLDPNSHLDAEYIKRLDEQVELNRASLQELKAIRAGRAPAPKREAGEK